MTFILIFTILALRSRIIGIKTNLMKCCHTINGSLPPCLGDSRGSDASLGGLGLALPKLGGGGLGSPGAPDLGGASTSI